ncbi:HpcH/HpaI aldolase/citrate lyase family protein [Comamonas composti]|uniref:HpcH/HpaI aldolase/citrate lyase family protein n=1 Tax=Comamonas composti TaxID=408558 RepID=UPI000428654A|nr:CoA ester lyase [Comamonas composti]
MNRSSPPALRSTLFVPGNRPERFLKAIQAAPGALIIDLEDAVAPADKLAARSAIAQAADQLRGACNALGVAWFVRINAHGTPWQEDDARACAQLPLDGVLLPKPRSADHVECIWHWTGQRPLHLLMETLHAFACIGELSRAPGVQRLMLGCADLMAELSIHDDDAPLHYFRTQIVMHSRLAGLAAPIDGVCLALDNPELLAREIDRALRFGFAAKACIHPRQVPAVDQGFRPGPEQVAWARKVLAASSDGRAVSLDGRLIDGPICEQAARILRSAI